MGNFNMKKAGIIAVAVLTVAFIVLAVSVKTGIFEKNKPIDGKYYFVRGEADGKSYSKQEMSAMGLDVNNLYFVIDGNEGDVSLGSSAAGCYVKVEGKDVIFYKNDGELKCRLNRKKGQLYFENGGVELIFKRHNF